MKDNKNDYIENNDADNNANYNVDYDNDIKRQGDEVVKKSYTSPQYRNLVIAIIVLSMLLAAALLVAINMHQSTNNYRTQLENQYERSFYDLTDNMNNIELRLSKLLVSNSDIQVEDNLYNIARQAESSQNSLSELPASHETINKTMRFINQLGDFCNCCAHKITNGQKLTDEQLQNLEKLYRTNKALTQELNIMASRLGSELSVLSSYNNDNMPNNFADGLEEIQNNSEYPTVDYEGPFADEVEDIVYSGLSGEEISQQQAEERIKEIFGDDMPISKIVFANESSGKLPTYNFSVRLESGNKVYVQITKSGGHPLFIGNNRDIGEQSLDVEQCVEKAEEFIERAGYEDVKSVWTSNYKGNVFVNLAPIVNDVVIYSDMIKVIIAHDNGELLGLETIAYITNHSDRDFGQPTLSAQEAAANVNSKLAENISDERLALIPVDGEEVLAWEITSGWEDLRFIVYLDANTGEELQVFRIVENQEGTKLL